MSDPRPSPLPELEELSDHGLATEPVSDAPAATDGSTAPPGGRRRRWLVALATVGLLAAATIVGAVVLVGAASDSTVARWAPPDALVYAEIRADLPGDQRAALGEFLSAFPGFADQASLDRKLTELYDRLVAAATDGEQSYGADIAPWFDGQLGVAAGPLPTVTALDDPAALADRGRALAIATVRDASAATAWVRATASEAGVEVRAVDAAGTELLLLGPESQPAAVAVTDRVLLLGDETSVRAALARGGSGGLSAVTGYADAVDALGAPQAATVYLDGAAYLDWLTRLPASAEIAGLPADFADLLPAWMAGGLRIEPDALVVSNAMPHPSAVADIADARSELPGRLPASTVVLVDVHDVGRALVEGLAGQPGADAQAMRQQLEEALRVVGGIEGLAGWMGETGLVVLADDTEALPGVVAIPTDATAAENLGRSLRNLATVGGLDPTDSSYAGVTVTTVDLAPLGAGGEPGSGPSELSWVVTDDLVVVGTTATFVKAVLDVQAGATLADEARFSDLLDRTGPLHRALVWADLDRLEALAVAQLEPAERARFETEIRPYLAPLDALIGVAERDGPLDRSRGLLVLDEAR